MLGFAYVFILVMILLGLDVLLWGTCLVLLGLGSVLVWILAGPDHLAAASSIFDTAIGVAVFAAFGYAVIMLFIRPALRRGIELAARHVPMLRGYAPVSYTHLTLPTSDLV